LQIALAFSPNGEKLSSAGWDNVIRIWEVSTGSLVKEIPAGGDRYIGALAFSPDGQKIASGGADDTVIKLWDTSTGALIATLKGHTSEITTLDFSPDGRLLASGSCCSGSGENSVRIWSTENYEELHLVEFRDEPILNVSFSPDGHLLAVAARDTIVKLWYIADWSEYKTLNSFAPDALLFADEGQTLVGASRDNRIWIWSVPRGEVLRFLEGHTDWVSDISLSSDSRLLASAGRTDLTLRIWDWKEGREVWKQTFDKNAAFVTTVAFSPVRNYLAVCVGSRVILLDVSY